jgi:hypothetical protein
MRILNHLVNENQKKGMDMIAFRLGYFLDIARVVEQLIILWEVHLIHNQQHPDLKADTYLDMFDCQFQSPLQGVAGGDFTSVPAIHIKEALQITPTTKLAFELLVSYLFEDCWHRKAYAFTDQVLEEFHLRKLVRTISMKHNENVHHTLGLSMTEVLDNSGSLKISGDDPAPAGSCAEKTWVTVLRRIYDKLRMVSSSFNFHHHGVNRNKLVTWIFDSPLLEMLEQYLIQITFNQDNDDNNEEGEEENCIDHHHQQQNNGAAGIVSLIVSIALEIELVASKESRLPCEQWPKVQHLENVFLMFKLHWLDNGKFLEMIEDDVDDSRKVVLAKRPGRGSSSLAVPVAAAPHCYFVSKKEMFLLLETESKIWSNVLINANMFQVSTSIYGPERSAYDPDEEDEILTISTLDADSYQLS